MPINCLYISYDGMTDPLGQSQVIPYLIGLTKKGYSFTLISCEKEEVFAKNKELIKSILDEHKIDWQPISYTKKPPILSTVFDVYRIKKLAFKLQQSKQFKIVHCRSYIAAMIGLQMKHTFQTKFIFDMRGFWADERVDGKLWNLKNPLYRMVYNYFKKKEKQFLENADYTISLTQNAKVEMLSWKHITNNPIKIQVIPCCADLDLFDKNNLEQQQITALKNELNIQENDYVLLYLGSIGTWYMLTEMMQFFAEFKKQEPSAKFLFVTKDEHERILKTAAYYNVKDAIIIRAGNRNEIPALISICHYSIFFILPSYSKRASSPTKQGEIMAMGKPVICNSHVGDTDFIVNNYNAGYVVKNVYEMDFSEDVNFSLIKKYNPEQIIAGAKDYFSLENGVQKYAETYQSVLAK